MSAAILGGAFLLIAGLVMRLLARRGPFLGSVGALALGWLFFYVVFPGVQIGSVTLPGIAMLATDSASPLPVPAFAFWIYMVLILVGILVTVSASDALLAETIRPIQKLLRGSPESGRGRRVARGLALYAAIPLFAAWLGFGAFKPASAVPTAARQAHPSISYDENLVNPYREPADETASVEEMTHAGRHLFAKNCAPCHGGKADGRGMVARALRLPPANFTDPGTIATLVEGYAFKRIQEGGIGLPAAGTPWDSAMPRWKGELSDDEIFKILLAEYDLAGVHPRVTEELE